MELQDDTRIKETSSSIQDFPATNFDLKFYRQPIYENVVNLASETSDLHYYLNNITSLLSGIVPSAKKQILKPSRQPTLCSHTHREFYAKGMCAKCYHR